MTSKLTSEQTLLVAFPRHRVAARTRKLGRKDFILATINPASFQSERRWKTSGEEQRWASSAFIYSHAQALAPQL